MRFNDTPKHARSKRSLLQANLQFAEFNTLKVSAVQAFAEGLSCVYSFLSHVDLALAPYPEFPYSIPLLRYELRMKPFTGIADPPCPPFEQFITLNSLRSTEKTAVEVYGVIKADLEQQALGILEVAATSMQEAKKKWAAISKWTVAEAGCVGCEQLWRADIKGILRSCVVASVAIDQAKKIVASDGTADIAEKLKVEIPPSGKSDHS